MSTEGISIPGGPGGWRPLTDCLALVESVKYETTKTTARIAITAIDGILDFVAKRRTVF
jgi:hypothetical protein